MSEAISPESLAWRADFLRRVEALAEEAHARGECAVEAPLRALGAAVSLGQMKFFAMQCLFLLDVMTGNLPPELQKFFEELPRPAGFFPGKAKPDTLH